MHGKLLAGLALNTVNRRAALLALQSGPILLPFVTPQRRLQGERPTHPALSLCSLISRLPVWAGHRHMCLDAMVRVMCRGGLGDAMRCVLLAVVCRPSQMNKGI
jgi:hypothetical protein